MSSVLKSFKRFLNRNRNSSSSKFYADGTFWVCLEIFFQLYTINGQRDGRIFPWLVLLLPNKSKNTYNGLFEQLFQLVNNLGNGPNDVLIDFERSVFNAFQNRNIEVQGCFYHLYANIWKHDQHLGLSQRYNQEEEFALHITMLPVLALLPAGDVIEGFEELVDYYKGIIRWRGSWSFTVFRGHLHR